MSNNFEWANDLSRQFLANGYLSQGQEVEDRVWAIAQHAEKLLKMEGFAEKFYDYMSRGWYSLSSPVWSNFGNNRGLPVSCFGTYVGDSVASILEAHAEIGTMSKFGGGCSAYFGDVRPRGSSFGGDNGETFGSVHFMELFQTLTNVISQGSVRRGFVSTYLPIEHGDYDEFIQIGTEGHPIQQLTHGVNIADQFMKDIKSGVVEKQQRWLKFLEARTEIGYPYGLFIDTVNRNTVDVYKDKEMKIHASNMCAEIALPSSKEESFVCVLSSMNLLHYDEWKDTDAVKVLTYFLDAVVEEFIQRLEAMRDSEDHDTRTLFNNMKRAYKFAKRHRALGLGILGWHSYLQSNMLAFEGQEAARLNLEISKHIQEQAWEASKELADLLGEPELLEGYGRRNTTLTAHAPTKSSSFILGQVSQSFEPEFSNYYVKDLAKIKTTIKNQYLAKVLDEHGINNHETWKSIMNRDGSVQHLDELTQHEKDVFKTYGEIDPYTILSQAAVRQEFTDQGQSLNLMVGPSTSYKEISDMYMTAHSLGIKSLYYQYSTSAAQELARSKGCVACSA